MSLQRLERIAQIVELLAALIVGKQIVLNGVASHGGMVRSR